MGGGNRIDVCSPSLRLHPVNGARTVAVKMVGLSFIRGLARRTPDGAARAGCGMTGDPVRMLEKLTRDLRTFRDLSALHPEERGLQADTAIHICVTIWRLGMVTEHELRRRCTAQRRLFRADRFRQKLAAAVPHQPICDAIADAARMAYWRDGRWPDGLVRLSWSGGGAAGGWMLQYADADGLRSLPILAFIRIDRDWRAFLQSQGLARLAKRSPRP